MSNKEMDFVRIYNIIHPRNFPKKDERGPTPSMRAYAEAQERKRFGIVDEICRIGRGTNNLRTLTFS